MILGQGIQGLLSAVVAFDMRFGGLLIFGQIWRGQGVGVREGERF